MERAIIVEAGGRGRRLDARLSRPRSLDPIWQGQEDKPALEWILYALRVHGVSDVTYVGGYHIEKVIERFPQLRFRYHGNSRSEGEWGAFLACDLRGEECFIIRASTLVLPKALGRMPNAPVAVGTYVQNRSRRPVGVLRLNSEAIAAAYEVGRKEFGRRKLGLDNLLEYLEMAGFAATEVDLEGLAAPIMDRNAIARTVFRGKAQALDNLAPLSRNCVVLERECFSVRRWWNDSERVLGQLRQTFGGRRVVVRSSTVSEDSLAASHAGKFRSVLGVSADDLLDLRRAIESVLESYSTGEREISLDDEVLVQRQAEDLCASGVLLTRDPRTGAPYFVLNEDSQSGRSDVVTSGAAGDLEASFIAWSAIDGTRIPESARSVIGVGRELMDVSRVDALDIEYGRNTAGVCSLFQVRPLASVGEQPEVADEDVFDLLDGATMFVKSLMRPRSSVAGRSTILGTMPDWNPAEMIGTKPRPLALSLYQTLVGDRAWAEARRLIGYKDVAPEPLIFSIAGRPYVDVRASLNSFLPDGLKQRVAEVWVDFCLERLRVQPEFHDRVEFEVAITCLAPDWPNAARRLAEAGISRADIAHFLACLQCLTARILDGEVEPIGQQKARIAIMGERRQAVLAGEEGDVAEYARRTVVLLDDCRRFGVIPFSILARYAFMSMAILKGLRVVGAITSVDYDAFLAEVPTVACELSNDLDRLAAGQCSVRELIASYGHLRPNSYEITSSNYASKPEFYLRRPQGGRSVGRTGSADKAIGTLLGRSDQIENAMSQVGLDIETSTLARFMVEAISGRESAKFEFMKNVDAALEVLARLGGRLGLSREQVSFIPISDLARLVTDSVNSATESHLRRLANLNEKRWAASSVIRLPDLIRTPDEVVAFRLEKWRSNFVTQERIVAPAVWLDEQEPPYELEGAIVVVRAADPGYDWIFGYRIAGMITQYGGAASHMAIRAAEFRIPAAIGCGDAVLDRLRGAMLIELDCGREMIAPA